MRLDGWRVDGFGGLAGWQVEALAEHELIVVCGPNESGKSTLREFIATAYFGFAPGPARAAPFRAGGRPASAVRCSSSTARANGSRSSASCGRRRAAACTAPPRTKTSPTGRCRRWPASPGRVYLDLHSLGLDELLRVDAGTWQSVEDRLLAGSALAFLRSAADVRRALDEQAAGALAPRPARPARGAAPARAHLRAPHARARGRRRPAPARRHRRRAGRRARARGAAAPHRLGAGRPAAPAHRPRAGAGRLARRRAAPGRGGRHPPPRRRLPGRSRRRRRPAPGRGGRRRARRHDARRQADQLQALADVPAAVRVLAERAGELRELAAEESGAADLRAAIGAAEAALRARRAEVDRRADAVLGRPLQPADRDALDAVRSADLRAAVTAAAVPARRSPSYVAGAAAVVAALLAVAGVGGRTIPALAARGAGRRGRAAGPVRRPAPGRGRAPRRPSGRWPSRRRGSRCPTRRCRPTSTISGAAAADADAAAAELHRLRTLAAARTTRLAEALRQLGLPSATQALQAVDDALIRVAEARRAGRAAGRRRSPTPSASRAPPWPPPAAATRSSSSSRPSRPGDGLDAAVSAVLTARRLRTAADERLRSANAAFGDLAAIAGRGRRAGAPGHAAGARRGRARPRSTPSTPPTRPRSRSCSTGAARCWPSGTALAALPGVADAAGEAAVYEEHLQTTERRRDRLAMTSSVLLHAERRFREQHGPGFLAAASGYLAAITGGRYDRLLIAEHTRRRAAAARGAARTAGRSRSARRCRAARSSRSTSRCASRWSTRSIRTGCCRCSSTRRSSTGTTTASTASCRCSGALDGRQAIFTTCHPSLAARLGAIGAAVIATPGLPQQPARVA